jgi:hypothetical protein
LIRLRRHRRSQSSDQTIADFESALLGHLDGSDPSLPRDVVGYLDHLASLERFVFHGSNRDDIAELRIERESTDRRSFGRQQAVYATPDPHWAAFFALVDRENTRSIRNASLAFSSTARTRWHQRDVVVRDPGKPFVREGSLYVLPRETFRAEPKVAGILDTAQWVSPVPVRPLFVLRLGPDDYPLARHIRAV